MESQLDQEDRKVHEMTNKNNMDSENPNVDETNETQAKFDPNSPNARAPGSAKQVHAAWQATPNNVLFLVAMVTCGQGLGFFAASFLGGSVPFLPRDPVMVIGVMYTVMGLGFATISVFCRSSQTKKAAHRPCFSKNVLAPEKHIPENSKKND